MPKCASWCATRAGRTGITAPSAPGNFNEETSQFYTDHMLLTSHAGLGADILEAFRFFQSNWQPPRLSHLVAAPFSLRAGVKYWIQNEIDHAKHGREAGISIKLNNLADPEITACLYEASQAGVKVQLIVRSMFSVITGRGGQQKHPGHRHRGPVSGAQPHSGVPQWRQSALLSLVPPIFCHGISTAGLRLSVRFTICALQQKLQHYLDIQWSDNTKARVLDKKLGKPWSSSMARRCGPRRRCGNGWRS